MASQVSQTSIKDINKSLAKIKSCSFETVPQDKMLKKCSFFNHRSLWREDVEVETVLAGPVQLQGGDG